MPDLDRLPDESCRYSADLATQEAVNWALAGAHKRPLAFLLPRLEAAGVKSVVEFGCGAGLLANALPAGPLYVGVDRCQLLRDKAESLCTGREKCRFFTDDVRSFPFPDDTPYDLSMAWSFMKHFALDEWGQVLAKVLRAGTFAAFDCQVAEGRPFDDGTAFPHVFVTEKVAREAVAAAGYEIESEEVFGEFTVGGKPAKNVAYWCRRRAAEGEPLAKPEVVPPACEVAPAILHQWLMVNEQVVPDLHRYTLRWVEGGFPSGIPTLFKDGKRVTAAWRIKVDAAMPEDTKGASA